MPRRFIHRGKGAYRVVFTANDEGVPGCCFSIETSPRVGLLAFFFSQFNRQWLSNAKSVFLECVCVFVGPPPQDGWRIACHFFFLRYHRRPHSIHVHPSIHPSESPSCCGGRASFEVHTKATAAQQHKSRRTIMNYLWSDITQAGRTTFSVAVAWAFAQLTAVSPESLRFLAPGALDSERPCSSLCSLIDPVRQWRFAC